MTAKELLTELKKTCPSIFFYINYDIDEDAQWVAEDWNKDEDSANWVAWIVDVSASCIVNGELSESHAYLGDS